MRNLPVEDISTEDEDYDQDMPESGPKPYTTRASTIEHDQATRLGRSIQVGGIIKEVP